MNISRRSALTIGSVAIGMLVSQIGYVLADIKCYRRTLSGLLVTLVVLFGPGVFVAFRSLLSTNPLRSIGACVGLGAWIGYAYYTDCILYRVTEGFGVLYVLILGTPSAMLGALLVNTFCLVYGIDVDPSPVKGSADAP